MINGFAGYFTSGLYQHCELSILPEKPTFGMYSWYPLFFCFLDAEYLAKGQDIEIDLWRKYTNKKVWYEWSYKIGDRQSIVHNKDGAYVAIELWSCITVYKL